ncbi:MAG: sulfotransferase domain-containing protein [Leptolyngbya sp.]|nr:sulfotransferase domain-containing protein [Leptolyngbya sp.]
MGKIYWLASYPKSGNTWMRILLANYLRKADHPAEINSLDQVPIASARAMFDSALGIETSDLTQDEIDRYRPLVYEHLSHQAKEPLFLKVHDAFTYTPYGYPLLSKTATAGVLYLVRNPLDVAVSFAHHTAQSVEVMVARMGNANFCLAKNPEGLHEQLQQRLLTWSGHVRSWLDEPDLRVNVVRYEDLQADTVGQLAEVVRFCGLEEDPDRMAQAVEFSRFDRVQQQENERGFREKAPLAGAFFRRGRVGSWRDALSPALVDQLIADHRPVMTRLGYLTASGDLAY